MINRGSFGKSLIGDGEQGNFLCVDPHFSTMIWDPTHPYNKSNSI